MRNDLKASAFPCLRGGILSAVLMMLTFGSSAFAQPPAHPEMLVSTSWLADHLNDKNLVIIHISRTDEEYKKQHIPGARLMLVSQIADMPDFPGTELLPVRKLETNLGTAGIDNTKRVVIYTTDYDPIAARLFFTLDYLGHGGRTALLDGGIARWMAENRPLTKDVPAVTPVKFYAGVHQKTLARFDWVRKNVADTSAHVAMVDARPMNRYEAGHLPGAKPLYWQDTQSDHLLKPPDELRKMFTNAGATKGNKMVSYCEVGQQASYVYFVARYLGLDAAMYDGSFNEWSHTKEPVVTGSSPR